MFDLKFSPYLTPILVGWIVGFWLGYSKLKSKQMNTTVFEHWVVLSTFFAPLFAYILNLLFFWVFEGKIINGLMYYGAIISFWFLSKICFSKLKTKEEEVVLQNVSIFVVAFASGVGRLGCLFSGCCHGIPLRKDFFFFKIEVFPSQMLELVFHFSVFFLAFFSDKWFTQKNSFSAYIVAYSCYRFMAEFFRGDHVGLIFGLSYAQCISLLVFIFYFVRRRFN